jgi:hypothetical protein
MKRMLGLIALAVMLSFGTVATVSFAGDAPAPTEKKDKKNPSGPKMGEEQKKKDKKGGN